MRLLLAPALVLLFAAACSPFEVDPAPLSSPWYPADNEVIGRGYFQDDDESYFYVLVWRDDRALVVQDPVSKCYDAATIRELLPAECPQPEAPQSGQSLGVERTDAVP